METVILAIVTAVLFLLGGVLTFVLGTLLAKPSHERGQSNGRFAGLG